MLRLHPIVLEVEKRFAQLAMVAIVEARAEGRVR
jgi:hypothetical protein